MLYMRRLRLLPRLSETIARLRRIEVVVRFVDKEWLLNFPDGGGDPIVVVAYLEAVLEDAANHDVRQGKYHLIDLEIYSSLIPSSR